MSYEKINVMLYGGKSIFGGKETPIEADEIFCDRASECTFYKENKCLRCRAMLLRLVNLEAQNTQRVIRVGQRNITTSKPNMNEMKCLVN